MVTFSLGGSFVVICNGPCHFGFSLYGFLESPPKVITLQQGLVYVVLYFLFDSFLCDIFCLMIKGSDDAMFVLQWIICGEVELLVSVD